jgi:MHS family alpha-ketoglutarate permease-like MFS transporter
MSESGANADINTSVANPDAKGLTTFQRIKAIMGGSAGNMVEWYDWFAYTSFSVFFAASFFPKGDPTAQLLAAQIPNVVSFLARPLGAWIMGRFSDHYGRKLGLIVAVIMMCVGSLILACAPTYAQVGMAAPWILGIARLIQGLSVGGQYGAAATYMSEMATRKRRGFWSSFQYVTLIGGQLLAVTVAIILQKIFPEAAIKDWAWRLAFFIGAGLAVVVLFIQGSLHETESYKNAKAAGHKSNTWTLFSKYPKEVLAIIGLTAAGTSGFYAYTTYMGKFLISPHHGNAEAHFTKPQASNINFIMLLIFMAAQPLCGHLADKFGRKKLLMGTFLLSAIAAYPAYTAISNATTVWSAALLCAIPLVLLSGYTSISAVVKAELFPAHVRALGVALPYAMSNAVFGAIVEPAALGAKAGGHETYFYWYISALMIAGLITAFLLRETKTSSLILED